MIKRLYLKELISFDSVDIEFDEGLVVLSGPSGAGKSLLMSSVLASFGIATTEAKVCEIEMDIPHGFSTDLFDVEDDIVIRSIKKDRVRYYLNDQNISKKLLKDTMIPYVNYLSVRDSGGFSSEVLLDMIDSPLLLNNKSFGKMKKEYRKRYDIYKQKEQELEKIQNDEKRLAELIEFSIFEINKIKSISPKNGEDEELLQLKRQLSRVDKINDTLSLVEELFAYENSVTDMYGLLEKDSSYFSDAMNQLRADCDDVQSLSAELEDVNVEKLLDRLEKISELNNRYGSIPEALEYMAKKEVELSSYNTIAKDKSVLISYLALEKTELAIIGQKISKARQAQSKKTSAKIDEYLKRLKMPSVSFEFNHMALSPSGIDKVELNMQNSKSSTLSGGEHNRLRLAMMVVSLESGDDNGSIIVLDEIDANVSGDESIAIADMISKLSSGYQIFAISHQPHLAAKANQHILVDKIDGKSRAMVLDREGQTHEISRIVGGELPPQEAIDFAEKLLDR